MQQTGLPSDEYTQYNHWGEILCVSFLKVINKGAKGDA